MGRILNRIRSLRANRGNMVTDAERHRNKELKQGAKPKPLLFEVLSKAKKKSDRGKTI